MGKKRNAKGTASVTQNIKEQVFSVDYEKLAKAIVHAQAEADALREKEKKEISDKQLQEWRKIMGAKTHGEENFFMRIFHSLQNGTVGFFKILFFKKKDVSEDKATFALLQTILASLFGLIKLSCYFVAIVGLVLAACYIRQSNITLSIVMVVCSIFAFIFGRLFRIVKYEIEKITDRNYMLSILSAVTALIAMILALVALVAR